MAVKGNCVLKNCGNRFAEFLQTQELRHSERVQPTAANRQRTSVVAMLGGGDFFRVPARPDAALFVDIIIITGFPSNRALCAIG